MTNLDGEIREALLAEHDEIFQSEDDNYAFFQSIKYMFRGSTRWSTFTHLAVMAVFVTTIVVSAYQFFYVESTRGMIAWSTALGVAIVLQGITELYFMMEIGRHTLRWEIKQLELQLAVLAQRSESLSQHSEQ